jgi:RNA polymerase sigma-70 factor (ECF subfamily)
VLRSRTEAEDVVQDVFIRVLEHRRSLSTVRDMRVWLIRIAWNLALDRKRRKRPEQLDESFAKSLASATMPADAAMEEAQRFQSVLREIERLPKAERHVLLLSAIEELGTAEIAVYWDEASRQCGRCSHERGRDCGSGWKESARDERC